MKPRTPDPTPVRETVGVRMAAAHLNVSPDTIRRRIAEGDLEAHRVGNLIRIYVDDLERLRRPATALVGGTPAGPDIVAARRNLKTEKLAAHIKRVVDEAPELTPDQRERLAQILRGGASC